VVLLADLISTGNRQAEEERAREKAAAAEAKRDLAEDQRPRRATLPEGAAARPALERGITADVRGRVRAGLLEGPIAATTCIAIGNGRGAYNCFTLSSRREAIRTIESGYRFSAKADLATGALAWCKRNPRPLHPDTGYFVVLPVSADCLP